MRLRDIYAESFTARSLPPEEPIDATASTVTKLRQLPTTSERNTTVRSAQIVAMWERMFGLKLSEKVVEAHIETLRRWESRLKHEL